MNTILRKQFLAHVGQTSPSPMLVEVRAPKGRSSIRPKENAITTWSPEYR